MKKKVIKSIYYAIFLLTGILLLFYAFRDISLKEFWYDLKNADYYWVLLSLLLGLLGFISRAVRWTILIEPLGFKPSVSNSFYAVCITYLVNLGFPRLGEVARCGSLYKTDNIPVGKLLGTVITERIIDFFSLIVLTVVIFFIKLDIFGAFLTEKAFKPLLIRLKDIFDNNAWIYLAAGAIIVFCIFCFLNKRFKNLKIYIKFKEIMSGIFIGIKSVMHIKRIWHFIFHTIFIWLTYILMTYVVFLALPSTSDLTIADAAFILIFGGIGMAIPVQGGIGTYHVSVAFGLSLYGIARKDGLVYATLAHESQMLLMIVLGIFSLIMVALIKGKKKQNIRITE